MEAFGNNEITDPCVRLPLLKWELMSRMQTVIMIENAERFGLCTAPSAERKSGKRKNTSSYCIFMTASKSDETKEKAGHIESFQLMVFFIAGEDLRLRGPGDLFRNQAERNHGF